MGTMEKYKRTKHKVGEEQKTKDIVVETVYNKHYGQVYQNAFDLFYDDSRNIKMRLYWFLFDRLTMSNYIRVDENMRSMFGKACFVHGNIYNKRKILQALSELRKEGKLISESKGLYCFNPCHVWIGSAEDREELIKRFNKKGLI